MTDEDAQSTHTTGDLVEITADIVSAYVSNNPVVTAELPKLITDTFDSLSTAAARAREPVKEELSPAVPIKRSVMPDKIVCLECGKAFKSLKRHLRTDHELTPSAYRDRWGLAHDYPLVSPNYAEARSKLARQMGLGKKSKIARP